MKIIQTFINQTFKQMETKVKGNNALKSEATEIEKKSHLSVVKNDVADNATGKSEETQKIENKEHVKVEVKPLSFEEIRAKGTNLFNLSAKYDQVKAKADELKKFKILHNQDVAQIQLIDALGSTFTSGNPKAISKFIAYCGEELETALKEVEDEMRKIA